MRAQTLAAARSLRLSTLRITWRLVLRLIRRAVNERWKARGDTLPYILVPRVRIPTTPNTDTWSRDPLKWPRNNTLEVVLPWGEGWRLRQVPMVLTVTLFTGISSLPPFPLTTSTKLLPKHR